MTRTVTRKAMDFEVSDIYGKTIKLSDFSGRAVILCFFRDTTRPSRNSRILELTRHYQEWSDVGVEIIVVFNDSRSQLKRFFEKRPRPFTVIADPKLELYDLYGVQRIVGKDLVAPTSLGEKSGISKIFKGGWAWLSPVGRLMPAEFLISPNGMIAHSWQGRSESDHIPFDRLETFVMSVRVAMRKKALMNKSLSH